MFRITPTRPAVSNGCPAALTSQNAAWTGRDTPSKTPGPAALEAGFRAWVSGHAKADVLVVGPRDPVAIPLEHALRSLTSSTQPLAPANGESLGLDRDATIGSAADALLQACIDPMGPRCRSYRSATYYLVGLALLAEDEPAEPSTARR